MKKIISLLEKRYIKFIFLAVSGILTGLTVCFPALGVLEWFSIIPMALVLYSLCESEIHRLRSLYAYGLFYFMCYFVTTWHWFYAMYPMSYTGMTKLAALSVLIAAMLVLPFIQAWVFAFMFVMARLIYRGYLTQKTKILFPFACAAIWAVLEWCQTLFWFGVPWGRLAIGQTGILVTAQTSSWFGCYFITFLLVTVNFLLAYALYSLDSQKLFSLTAASIFTFNIISGSIIFIAGKKNDSEKTVKIAAIQANISSTEKWSYDWFEKTTEPLERLTKEAVADGAEIVVWSETVLPVSNLFTSFSCKEFIKELAQECNATILVGTNVENEDGEMLNSIVTVDPNGKINDVIYSKQNLVPFGEFMPMEDFILKIIPALEELNIMENDWTPGKDSYVVDTGIAKIGSAICFDSIYERNLINSVRNGAEIIAIETNDSWFYDSPAVSMHLAQAQLRAIETSRYVVRSANTGISAIITSTGQITDIEPALTDGYCIDNVILRNNRTLYSYIGNAFVYLCIAYVVSVFVAGTILKIKHRDN